MLIHALIREHGCAPELCRLRLVSIKYVIEAGRMSPSHDCRRNSLKMCGQNALAHAG